MGSYIIEFNGIPGSGKSTITNNLEKHLVDLGYTVVTDKEIFIKQSNIIKFIELICFSFKLKQLKLNGLLLLFYFKMFKKERFKRSFVAILKIIRYNGLLNKAKKNCDFILMSEGNKQFIEVYLDDIEYYKEDLLDLIVREINSIHSNSITFTCYINKEEAVRRVLNRGFYPNPILNNKEALDRFIEKRSRNMIELKHIYSNYSNYIEVDTSYSIEEILNNIFLLIKQRK